ncbi:hypothetical protein A3A67_01625 [Candidatus Peribacteria bacterium RIFCSPLOWO2_01_FULL_51_18]|nr:MAG: hypothetical protein A3C52_03935 [Candidatus Peribacteria bacterium RIFCSPHIGHO2_02_FULL_51_15]OGJ65168.1 MAG: hypothetical protein A3A67_01625 [Candidatus Peribacteria bacterium RIFCSPLOWO2_01_FULL_51_18]OGJ68095.1 MAG: hypothetical protein A3J34_02170 [Candidatus Peribacteria bacterium RIFCSPLOWO2_02_FULL_51_10]
MFYILYLSRRISVAILISALIFLSSCTNKPPIDFRIGPAAATGTIIPVEVSLVRRGTHALAIDGETKFYLESKIENLRSYEGLSAFVRGRIETNVRSEDLPVMVVDFVKTAYGQESLHIWEIPALDLRIKAPDSWDAKIEKGIVTFYLKNEPRPLIVVSKTSSGSMPPGSSIYIAGRRAVRATQENNTVRDIYVEDSDSVINFHFDVSAQNSVKRVEEGQILISQFDNLILSLGFLSDKNTPEPSAGSGSSVPCGGSAGILCGAGYFCDITDTVENIGKCVKIGN